jgi:hypothetical protein
VTDGADQGGFKKINRRGPAGGEASRGQSVGQWPIISAVQPARKAIARQRPRFGHPLAVIFPVCPPVFGGIQCAGERRSAVFWFCLWRLPSSLANEIYAPN